MSDPKRFLKVRRQTVKYRMAEERRRDYREVAELPFPEHSSEQAGRCMNCGTPFCHWGCPLGNYIPEWNELIFHGHWPKAFELLNVTNNFPEFTGRLCPALCEYSCVLGINDDPITIRENELAIIENAFQQGLVKPFPPNLRTGKKIAVVGSGPSGLACAAQLRKAGHEVVVWEKEQKVGGALRYGIPDFKLDKRIIDRRVDILIAEGIEFVTGVNVGVDYPIQKLKAEFSAICLSGGSRLPRDLKIPGRELTGIYFALDYLTQSNRLVAKDRATGNLIKVENKQVVVIGGGDTGADCVGTAHRQGAAGVVQIELLPRPPECRTADFPWPKYPMVLKTSTSHEEGGVREWAVLTKKFVGENGRLKKLACVRLDFSRKDEKNCPVMKEIAGSEFEIETEIIILAMGFLHPEHSGLLEQSGVEFDQRGNIKTDQDYKTSIPGVFSAGDMHRGQSLIVWAISEGRRAAYCIDKSLMGKSNLPII